MGLPELQKPPLLAKVDTGAWSNTLHASEIQIIEGRPETRVSFRLDEGGDWVERPLFNWRRIRDTGGH